MHSSSGRLSPLLNRQILNVASATPAVCLNRIDKIRPKSERLIDNAYYQAVPEKKRWYTDYLNGMLKLKLYFIEASMKKYIIITVVALLVAAAGIYFFKNRKPEITYKTVKLERGTIVSTVAATGNLSAVTTIQVGTQVSGTIQKLYVDYNSRVKKGQTIAEIDPSLFNAAVEQSQGNFLSAEANLQKAKVTVADAERTLQRNKKLLADGIISQGDYDLSETAWQSAKASLTAAEGSVAQTRGALMQARTNLRYSIIRSPVDGIVISRAIDVGQTVAASFQTPTLFTIAQDLTKMQIEVSVDEADI